MEASGVRVAEAGAEEEEVKKGPGRSEGVSARDGKRRWLSGCVCGVARDEEDEGFRNTTVYTTVRGGGGLRERKS